jgi:small subunit ribosomal protein S2
MSDDQIAVAKPAEEPVYLDPQYKDMADVGLFYGRKCSKTNPKMKPYILGNRNEIEIINLAKTKDVLAKALEFIGAKVQAGGQVLLIGTQPPAHGVTETAKKLNLPLVSNRWIGGTLTNWKVISTRIEYFKKLKSDLAKGLLEKYTKKERLDFARDIKRYEETMGGLEGLTGFPAVVVVIDTNIHMTAVREARLLKLPIVALMNTDSDPDMVQYPVAGNTKARQSINWFLEKLEETIAESMKAREAAKPAVATAVESKK